MRRLLLILFSACVLTAAGQVRPRVYLANDDHTDFIWTAGAETYHKVFLETIDYYLNLADETACDSLKYQSRWNCDGSYWMWIYEKNRSKDQFMRLISGIKDGHISIPLNPLSVSLGSTPAEAVIRGMYYPGKIEREYGVSFPLAYQVENQTMAYGLGSLWAGSGARYSWAGICGCDTRVKGLNERENYIYWWIGPDSSRLLMKWYPLFESNQSIGGYAEARHSWPQEGILLKSPKYPYRIVGLFGKGWDDLETLTREMITNAKMMSFGNKREVIVSNEIDFFQDFEKTYGDKIPSQSYGFGNEWELYSAYMQETTSRMLRNIEKLRGAEALATLVSLRDNEFMDKYSALRDSAWMSVGLFWDHDWGTVDRYNYVDERISWQKHLENVVGRYVNRLYDDALGMLGKLIPDPGKHKRYFVFNPLGKDRTDIADIPYSGQAPFKVADLASGESVPYDIVSENGQKRVRILAKNIPSVGYKVYEIQPGKTEKTGVAGTFRNNIIETPFYIIRLRDDGAISGIKLKKDNSTELVKEINGKVFNDLGSGHGKLTLAGSGYNYLTVKAEADYPLRHTSYITLYREIPRIDIRNEIIQNFSGTHSWTFSVNISDPQVWHEEVGAVVKAAMAGNGGHYSRHNGRYDWLTLNHFADIGNESTGITISSPDCNFMQLGNSTIDSIDTATPIIKILVGTDTIAGSYGKPFIKNQAGEKYFLQRFALLPHNKPDVTESMQFALEHQTPLICGEITGGEGYPEKRFSLISISEPHVLLWSVKPAEEGIGKEGVVVRCWNLSDRMKHFSISSSYGISAARKLTHIETPLEKLEVKDNSVAVTAAGQQIVTLSFRPERH